MDVSELEGATEELAGCLSEVTAGDLGASVGADGESIGDLLVRVIEQNLRIPNLLTGDSRPAPLDRAALLAPRDVFGTGYELAYRRAADDAREAFAGHPHDDAAAALYAELVRACVADADRLRHALALD